MIRKVLPCTRVPHTGQCRDGVEVLAVKVTLPSGCLTFFCVYRGSQVESDFSKLLSVANDEPTFIGSEFNAHHEGWGSRGRDCSGRHFALLNTGVPTHVAGGVLDLSSVSRPLDVGQLGPHTYTS